MESRNFYNEILTDHNLHPVHKEDIPDANLVLEGLNPSCGDHIWLKLKVEDGIIKDGGFVGDGCAISQASADIMLDLIIGKKKEEAVKLAESFLKMIKGTATEEEIESVQNIGSHVVSLGPRILRTETASVVASSIVLYELSDIGGDE